MVSSGEAEGVSSEFVEKAIEVAAGECPLEGVGCMLIASLELKKTDFKFDQRFEVVGREELALNDREVDLDLVEPASMNGGWAMSRTHMTSWSYPSELMRIWPISKRVNKPENDDPRSWSRSNQRDI